MLTLFPFPGLSGCLRLSVLQLRQLKSKPDFSHLPTPLGLMGSRSPVDRYCFGGMVSASTAIAEEAKGETEYIRIERGSEVCRM